MLTCVRVPVVEEYLQSTYFHLNRRVPRPRIVTWEKYFWAEGPTSLNSYLSAPQLHGQLKYVQDSHLIELF